MEMFFGGWSMLVFIFLYVPIVLLVGYSFNKLAAEHSLGRLHAQVVSDSSGRMRR